MEQLDDMQFSSADLKPTNVSKIESVPGKIGKSSGNVDEFDLLAQSRTTTESSSVAAVGGSGTAGTLRKDPEMMAKETEFDEMAAWLKNNVSRLIKETYYSVIILLSND